MNIIKTSILLIALLISLNPAQAQTGNPACGSLKNGGGPFDYRNERTQLSLVEGAHFTEVVEALIKGTSGWKPGGDIDFTLRVFPNNHRALIAMMRLGEKEKTTQPSGSRYSIECWFERALRFRPDDGVVRMIYSTYLNSKGQIPAANAQLKAATAYAKDSGITHYNIGLHYFNLKNYSEALVQAHRAMDLDWPQTALRDQLKAVGQWAEPPVLTSEGPAAESAADQEPK